MKKHTYRAQKVNHVNWGQWREKLGGQAIVLSIDVAKEQQFGVLANPDLSAALWMQWNRLEETTRLIDELKQKNGPITVVMESTIGLVTTRS